MYASVIFVMKLPNPIPFLWKRDDLGPFGKKMERVLSSHYYEPDSITYIYVYVNICMCKPGCFLLPHILDGPFLDMPLLVDSMYSVMFVVCIPFMKMLSYNLTESQKTFIIVKAC
jgi:hypothetical protein